jgi:competence protein ComGC
MRSGMLTRKGFGQAETAVVIIIIGFLFALAIPNYLYLKARGMEAAVKGNAHTVQMVVEEWATDHNGVLPEFGDLTPALFPGGVMPQNPFTGNPSVLNAVGIYSQGNLGYRLEDGIYLIVGYGAKPDGGPGDDGIIVRLTNG